MTIFMVLRAYYHGTAIAKVHSVHLMNAAEHQAAPSQSTDPLTQQL